MSITHSIKQILLLDLLINCISTRSAPQILSIKGGFTFPFSNFLIIDLCNSSVYSLFEIFLFLITLLPNLFACVAEQSPFDIHHILDFSKIK